MVSEVFAIGYEKLESPRGGAGSRCRSIESGSRSSQFALAIVGCLLPLNTHYLALVTLSRRVPLPTVRRISSSCCTLYTREQDCLWWIFPPVLTARDGPW